MHSDDTSQPTKQVETEEQALTVLLAWMERERHLAAAPTSHATVETDAGWAFFDRSTVAIEAGQVTIAMHDYLGTVTWAGEVIQEEQEARQTLASRLGEQA
jgi:hypothetical protein